VLRLGARGVIHAVEVDTAHFKGNAPERCALSVYDAGPATAAGSPAVPPEDAVFTEVLPKTRLQPHTRHLFEDELCAHVPATHARFAIYPDGGVSRLRLFGRVTPDGRSACTLRRLNHLSEAEALAALRPCCASGAWAQRVLAWRPFADLASLQSASTAAFHQMMPAELIDAFASHPRIGERPAASSSAWSAQEQARVTEGADAAERAELSRQNAAYEERFGYRYIVCATGRSAAELLGLLGERLAHEPTAELSVAAEELRRITALRLEKLLS
jgi:allantoicase